MLPIALQLYSLRNEAAEDLAATLEAVKAMGYDGVEFADLYGHSPEAVKALCETIGLVPLSAHVTFRDLAADPEKELAAYKAAGCSYVAVPYLTEEDRPGGGRFSSVIEAIGRIGQTARDMGITLLYHNHDFEFVKLDGRYALDILYEQIPSDLLQTELDVCWVAVGGEEPAAYLRKYTGRAPVVHFKDYAGEKSENMYGLIGMDDQPPKRPTGFEFRPLGRGVQNIPSLLAAADEAGAEWIVVEQDEPSPGLSALDCAAESLRYLRELGR